MEDTLVPIVAMLSIFVAPLWLILHYRDRRRLHEIELQKKNVNNDELHAVAERMEKRIEALEDILDTEAPGWRKRHEHS
ncbi:MAG: envelope stress response membrane protein PspB [Nevskiaceae bacterium]|nr:MAG: envelope stress response membrane protein PspB [Nevskiaceae bacterium]